MAKVSYQAITTTGKIIKGVVDAKDKQQALTLIKGMGLHPVSVHSRPTISISNNFMGQFKKISNAEILLFINQLSTMLKAGISLIASFDVIISQTKNAKFKEIISQIKLEVSKGRSFSDVLTRYPEIFPPLFSNIIKAGEESGKLELVLDRYASFIQKKEKIKSDVKSALTYPAFLMVLSIGVSIFMMTFIVPKYAELLKSSKTELPGTMQLLISSSSFITHYYHIILITIGIIALSLIKLVRTEKGSYYLDVLKLKIPIVGSLATKIILSRFVRTMGTLLTSGVPFLKNLKLATNVIQNKFLLNKLKPTFDNIAKGDRVAHQFENTGVFTPLVIQMITIGERSGTLDKIFDEVADIFDAEIETSVKRLTTALEPLVLLMVASGIGFIAISLVSSVMKAVNTFQ
jgi:type IV pilus assembly protein PilC